MKFLFILSWLVVFYYIFSLFGCVMLNQEPRNKALGIQRKVSSLLSYAMLLSIAYIIYWFVQ